MTKTNTNVPSLQGNSLLSRTGWTISPQLLLRRKLELSDPKDLKVILESLVKYEACTDPKDEWAYPEELVCEFSPEGLFVLSTGQGFRPVSTNAASVLNQKYMAKGFFTGLKQLASLSDEGRLAATDAAQAFFVGKAEGYGKRPKSREKVRVRTAIKGMGKLGHRRMVRAVVSRNYAPYSQVDLVKDLLRVTESNGGSLSDRPVLLWEMGDTKMTLRFAFLDEDRKMSRALMGDSDLLSRPIPFVEVWNSETGSASVGLRAGVYKLKTESGFPHWSSSSIRRWSHTGGVSSRVKANFRAELARQLMHARELVDLYSKASRLVVSDIEGFIAQLDQGIQNVDVKRSFLKRFRNAKVTKITNIIDEVAHLGSYQPTVEGRELYEAAASDLLRQAVKAGDKYGDLTRENEWGGVK